MGTNALGRVGAACAVILAAMVGVAHGAQAAGCRNADIVVTFDFEGAGDHACVIAPDGAITIAVRPEDQPINPSPWFAFELTAEATISAQVALEYVGARHRYSPKLWREGSGWTALPEAAVIVEEEGRRARLSLPAFSGRVRIAAQPIETPAEAHAQIASLLAPRNAERVVYGRSREGRDLIGYAIGSGPGLIIAITRQHPPETTGADAFDAFVRALALQPGAADALLGENRVLLAPMPNPDGVAGGHWRHNAGGMDLNRDWGLFSQPESQSLARWIESEAVGRRVRALLDFHSTNRTVIYAPPREAPAADIALLGALEAELAMRLDPPPAWTFTHDPDAGTTKAWALERFAAVGITVELSDRAGPQETAAVGAAVAAALVPIFSGGGGQARVAATPPAPEAITSAP